MNMKRLSVFSLATVLAMVMLIPQNAEAAEVVIYEYDSVYHHIRVVQEGSMRGLRFDNNHYQTKINFNNPLTGHFNYIDLLFQSFLFKPDPENVLMLGLGGGSAQSLFHHYQPELKIQSVEIDPAVVNVAERYFFYNRDALPVDVSDARAWLRRSTGKFDMIIQDTYSSNRYGTFIPFHLATLEYWTLVKSRLSDDGVLAVNVIGTVYGGEPNRVITSVYRTMREVFPQIYLFAATDVQNVVVIATMGPNRLSSGELQRRASELVRTRPSHFPPNLASGTYRFYDTVPSGLSGAIILTDDYAPTDNLLR
ncbi:MAG TPA: hypothetical protein ENN67_07375 [Firmicutes bacterium]|nr:hypothetical protein [Bacillota bacterium]